MSLTRLARTDVPTAAPETPVTDIVSAMRAREASVVVVLEEGRPVGLLTDADLGRAYIAGELADDSVAVDICTEPTRVSVDADLPTLVAHFDAEGTRHAVLVTTTDDFEGVVTVDDIVVEYGRQLTDVLSLLSDE
ncbi:MAG: CBS domain-containing protein [Halobacteriota archaeon]